MQLKTKTVKPYYRHSHRRQQVSAPWYALFHDNTALYISTYGRTDNNGVTTSVTAVPLENNDEAVL